MDRLTRSEDWYHVIVEMSPHAILIVAHGRIEVANRAGLQLLGAIDADQVVGRPVQRFFGAEIDAVLRASAGPVAAAEEPTFDMRVLRCDGRERELEVKLAAVPDRETDALQFVMRDVTERVLNARLGDMSGDKLRRLSGSLVEAREDERRRIARELHDELGQRLSAIKMEISSLLAGMAPTVKTDARVDAALRLIDQTMSSVRRIAANLRPAMLDDLGLEAAIEWLTADWAERAGLAIVTRCEPLETELSDGAKTAIYRTVQEALTNVTRHARASRVDVALKQEGSQIVVTISDNGQGLAPDAIGKSGSFGLIGMRERALLLGGTLAIKQSSLGGCRLELRLPVERQAIRYATVSQGNA